MKQHLIITSGTTSIICGGLLYLFFRTESLIMFRWLDKLNFQGSIQLIRKNILSMSINLPDWMIFSLPDGLWIFSYTCFVMAIWKGEINMSSLFWLLIIPLIIIIHEFLQITSLMPGTFDFFDLIFYFAGIITPIILFRNYLTYKIREL